MTGGQNDDILSGGNGNDVLFGDFGKDTLTGGANADVFAFTRALGATNIDTITDFKKVDDTIYLENAIFTKLGLGALSSALFYAKAGATHGNDADDRIIYNTSNGRLYYDDDGKGSHAGVLFAVLSGHPSIGAADFFVV
jgi:Ca2+-binding RTX toxin-like protein